MDFESLWKTVREQDGEVSADSQDETIAWAQVTHVWSVRKHSEPVFLSGAAG